jgi:site-specific recombinase XerC
MDDATALHLAAYQRHLKLKKRSARTMQSYTETIGMLSAFHGGTDVTALDRAAIEEFLLDQLARHTSTTAGLRFRNLRAFYNWCIDEEIIEGRSPMARLTEPKPTETPPPVLDDDQLRALLKVCAGKEFTDRRDNAIIRLWCEPGSPRVSEMAGIAVADLDMRTSKVTLRGKGDKVRDIPFGDKTGLALDRYLRLRGKHSRAKSLALWVGPKGQVTASGLYQMLERRAEQAGIGHVHPHQLRHTAAHVFADNDGTEGEAMKLFGWSSPDMARRYGQSAAIERAHRKARRLSLGDRL